MESANVFFGAIIFSIVFGVLVGGFVEKDTMQKKAVEANVAYYDNKTKEFKFIDVKDK